VPPSTANRSISKFSKHCVIEEKARFQTGLFAFICGILNRFSRFIFPLLIAAGVTACKQEPHVAATEPVFRTAQSLHMVSRLWEMVHLTGTGKSAEVLPAGVRRKWIDSTLADMDGLEYEIDFGRITASRPNGRLCPDGFYRGGRFRVRLNSFLWLPGLYAELHMLQQDTCTWSDGTTLIPLRGKVIFQMDNDWSYRIDAYLSSGHENDSNYLRTESMIAFTEDKGFPGQASNLYRLEGEGSLYFGQDSVNWNVNDPLLKRINADCMGSFFRGTLEARYRRELYSADFNPYGNDACDRWIKIWKGRSEYLVQLN
jgi:hypothetical protein